MAVVFIPALMQDLTAGANQVQVAGRTLHEIIINLEAQFPGVRERLIQDDDLRPDLAIAVDGEVVLAGLTERVREDSEVHFVPPISGG